MIELEFWFGKVSLIALEYPVLNKGKAESYPEVGCYVRMRIVGLT